MGTDSGEKKCTLESCKHNMRCKGHAAADLQQICISRCNGFMVQTFGTTCVSREPILRAKITDKNAGTHYERTCYGNKYRGRNRLAFCDTINMQNQVPRHMNQYHTRWSQSKMLKPTRNSLVRRTSTADRAVDVIPVGRRVMYDGNRGWAIFRNFKIFSPKKPG